MNTELWLWLGFGAFVALLLTLDLGILYRKSRVAPLSEALAVSAFYFLLAAVFAGGVFYWRGAAAGYEFVAGYLIEWSLSVDNIFVFVLIFGHFAVPPKYQRRVLFWGVVGALAMRGALIAIGGALIAAFHWAIFVFGAFLIVTSVKMLRAIDAKPDLDNNLVINFLRRRFRVLNEYRGDSFLVRRDGVLHATPLLLVLVLVEFTDLVFAVDSIPAIFAITTDPFIVYTSNVFALLGLRSLYFALAGVIHRFHYLKYGLALTLGLVGAKMIVNGILGEKAIPTEIALAATALLIGGSIVLSLIRTRGRTAPASAEEFAAVATGWVPGTKKKPSKKP